MVVTVEQVLGSQANSMGGATENGSMFNPGITSPLGSAKRWLTPGPTPSGWVSPGPPCTITNASGQVTSAFVEIIGSKGTISTMRTMLSSTTPSMVEAHIQQV